MFQNLSCLSTQMEPPLESVGRSVRSGRSVGPVGGRSGRSGPVRPVRPSRPSDRPSVRSFCFPPSFCLFLYSPWFGSGLLWRGKIRRPEIYPAITGLLDFHGIFSRIAKEKRERPEKRTLGR